MISIYEFFRKACKESGVQDFEDEKRSICHTVLRGYDNIPSCFEFIHKEGGGGEGGAQECHSIIKWSGRYWRVEYLYFSYDGFDYEDGNVFEVAPKEKTIIVYEEI